MKILDILTSPWAIMPEKLLEITDIYATHLRGEKIDIKGIEARLGHSLENEQRGYDVVNNVAIVPVQGVLARRMNMFHRISGGSSMQMILNDFLEAMDDESVNAIILDVDSPGGTVDGTADLARAIYDARGTKPIVTLANGLMASAGYWIGSASDKIYIGNETTAVGSIGVVTSHTDYSEYYKKQGVKITDIYAGKYKRINSENKPLSKEGKQVIQDQVDYLYSIFVSTIAKHRGVSVQTVLDDMADARMFVGQQAIDAGLVDGVSTMSALIESLSGGDLKDLVDEKNIEIKVDGTLPAFDFNFLIEDEIKTEIPDQPGQEYSSNYKGTNMTEITKGYILDKHPDIAEALREEGRASVDVAKIASEAAANERERVKGVFDQSMPGHEAMISDLAFDGKTTGPEAAVKILQAEKSKLVNVDQAMDLDAQDMSGVAPSSERQTTAKATVDPDAPIEERAKAEWSNSPSIRSEFLSFDNYIAFKKADEEGLIKIRGGKK